MLCGWTWWVRNTILRQYFPDICQKLLRILACAMCPLPEGL